MIEIGSIVNQQIDTAEKIDQPLSVIVIGGKVAYFVIGDVSHRPSPPIDPVAQAIAGVIEP